MDRIRQIKALNRFLLEEMPEDRAQAARFPEEEAAQRRLLRSLMNLRPPSACPLAGDITRLQADAIVNAGNSALPGCFWPLWDTGGGWA